MTWGRTHRGGTHRNTALRALVELERNSEMEKEKQSPTEEERGRQEIRRRNDTTQKREKKMNEQKGEKSFKKEKKREQQCDTCSPKQPLRYWGVGLISFPFLHGTLL